MNTAKTQVLIREKYGDKVDEATERLCKVCLEAILTTRTGEFHSCNYGLFPICRDGSECPYFRKI